MAQLHYWNELKKSLKEGIELDPAERDFGAYNVSELDPNVKRMMDYMRQDGEATWDQPAVAAHVGSKDAMATGWYEGVMCDKCAADLLEDIKAGKVTLHEAEYQGREVPLGKPMKGDVKKYKVYVKNDSGNVVKVNFGDPNMSIKRDNPERRKAYRARHNCSNPGPRDKANYWSCRMWSSKPVSKILKGK